MNARAAARFIDPALHRITRYASMAAFDAAEEIPPGIVTVVHNGVEIDVNNNWRRSDTTIVCFNAAIPAQDAAIMRFPVFTGSGVTSELPVNRIFVNDPSLYVDESLLLAWYAGNRFQPDLQEVIARIVNRITRQHGVTRTILFGASGGGFAAMQTATRLPGSIAVPVNPQTNLARYHATPVRKYASAAWGIDPEEYDPLALVPATTDLVAAFAEPVDARVVYVQNTGDASHVERHYAPFVAVAGTAGNRVDEVLVDCGPGHVAPPKDTLRGVLAAVAAGEDVSRFATGALAPAR